MDQVTQLRDTITSVMDDMTQSVMQGACQHVCTILVNLLAGEAVAQCADDLENMKLWAASLDETDDRLPKTVSLVKFTDAIFVASPMAARTLCVCGIQAYYNIPILYSISI